MASRGVQDRIRKSLVRKFGSDTISTQEDLQHLSAIPYGLSAQCLTLDLAIGRPGMPAGRLTEIVGLDGRSKSTHAYHILAEVQRVGGIGVLIETEQAFETTRLQALGVDPSSLIICQPHHLEEAFEMMEKSIISIREEHGFSGPVAVVFDSVAGTPSSAETAGEYDGSYMAVAARVISLSLRKLIRLVAHHKIVLVFLNQLKATMARFGEEFVSYGGRAIKYHASLRIHVNMAKKDIVLKNKEPVGAWITARIIKNKLAIPNGTAKYYMAYDSGICPYEDSKRSGMAIGYVEESGRSGYTIDGERILKKDWTAYVDQAYNDPHVYRDHLTREAAKRREIQNYGTSTKRKRIRKKNSRNP